MEAIAELIAALVGALVEVLFAFLQVVAGLLAIALEFVFLALTQGISAASQQYKHRKEERAEHRAAAKTTAATPVPDNAPSINLKPYAILASIVFFVIICSLAAWVIQDRIQQQRVAETRSQVKKLADKFTAQIKDEEVADPIPGKLRDRDAWQQPIELFVDKALLGSLVVVRSSGPDRKSGTIDDLLEMRVTRAAARDVGGKLAKRGIKAIRDRVTGLLPGSDKEQQPKDIDAAK